MDVILHQSNNNNDYAQKINMQEKRCNENKEYTKNYSHLAKKALMMLNGMTVKATQSKPSRL